VLHLPELVPTAVEPEDVAGAPTTRRTSDASDGGNSCVIVLAIGNIYAREARKEIA